MNTYWLMANAVLAAGIVDKLLMYMAFGMSKERSTRIARAFCVGFALYWLFVAASAVLNLLGPQIDSIINGSVVLTIITSYQPGPRHAVAAGAVAFFLWLWCRDALPRSGATHE